jgi:hypothetical protein
VAPLLYREIHNAGGASNGGGDCTGSKVVGGYRSAERKFQVSVRIDAPGYYVLAGGVDRFVGLDRQVDSDGAYLAFVNQDIGHVAVNSSENVPVFDQDAHGPLLSLD